MSDFIQIWQPYLIAIDNKYCGSQVVYGSRGQVKTIYIPDLIDTKEAIMLEF